MAESVTQSTVRGFAWNVFGIATTRVLTAVSQLVLAWILTPDDFGLVGLCYTVVILAQRLQEMGVRSVLIQRARRFHRWATPAFWMSLLAGIGVGLLICATSPLVARFYDEPRLVPLLILFALACPFDGLYTVPSAVLHSQMRFRELVIGSTAVGIGSTILSIVLAMTGFGVYSFPLARTAAAAALPAVYWLQTRPKIGLNPRLRLWPYVFGDSFLLLLAGFVFSLIGQVDYMALGLFRDTDEVGVYFMAYTLSVQLATVFALNLGNVLFPALGKLQTAERQLGATIRALSGLAVLALPLCFVQALLARPAIDLLFDDEWQPMIPMFQVLSVGMALRLVGWPSASLLYARRRFGLHLVQQLLYLAVLFPAVMLGAWRGGGLGTAIAVAAATSLIEPLLLWWRLRELGGGLRELRQTLLAPATSALLATAAGVGAAFAPGVRESPGVAALVSTVVMAGLYAVLIRYTARDTWTELSAQALSLVGRFGRLGAVR